MSRKLLVLTVVVGLLAAMLPGVSLAQDQVTIRYFNFSSDPDHIEDLATIVAAFEEANPGIKVDVSSAPYADYFTLLQADFVGNDPPDTFELNYESFVSYAANDVLLDLTSYLDPAAPYYPRALEAFQYKGVQGALPETFLVRLLSIAQARHAPAMANGPHGTSHLGRPPQERTAPPATIAATPRTIRRPEFSRKTNHAITAVSTPSRFSSSDDVAPDVTVSPTISRIGAIAPPDRMAPMSQGASRRQIGASV